MWAWSTDLVMAKLFSAFVAAGFAFAKLRTRTDS
jgi:hypothetical protein